MLIKRTEHHHARITRRGQSHRRNIRNDLRSFARAASCRRSGIFEFRTGCTVLITKNNIIHSRVIAISSEIFFHFIFFFFIRLLAEKRRATRFVYTIRFIIFVYERNDKLRRLPAVHTLHPPPPSRKLTTTAASSGGDV